MQVQRKTVSTPKLQYIMCIHSTLQVYIVLVTYY